MCVPTNWGGREFWKFPEISGNIFRGDQKSEFRIIQVILISLAIFAISAKAFPGEINFYQIFPTWFNMVNPEISNKFRNLNSSPSDENNQINLILIGNFLITISWFLQIGLAAPLKHTPINGLRDTELVSTAQGSGES
jgi:hypothetical protein